MPVPTYDKFMLPLLQFHADRQPHHIREAIDQLPSIFNLTEDEQNELIPSGRKTKVVDRIQWAATYLRKAELLESAGRGTNRITEQGIAVLQDNPPRLDRDYLMQFPAFVEFQTISRVNPTALNVEPPLVHAEPQQTPEEAMDAVSQGLKQQLADDLLDIILNISPSFFEKLVVDLLLAMGYGGSLGSGRSIGQSGDGGIDGYIAEDKLGLDVIYIQAKRWSIDSSVGRPIVQAFVGSLMGMRATKGVFITTSSFSKQAYDYVGSIPNVKVILINGQELTQLMIEHGVGVSIQQTYVIKKVDRDYFDIE